MAAMASVVLHPDLQRFPVGTSVGAYARAGLNRFGSPTTSVLETQTVQSDASLTFTTLSDGTDYVAYANVGGSDLYIQFRSSEASPSSGASGVVASVPKVLRSYNPALEKELSFGFPSQMRPAEPTRIRCVVKNLGTTNAQVAFGANPNGNFNSPSWTGALTILPGQEWESVGSTAPVFARPAVNGETAKVGVYAEIGAA